VSAFFPLSTESHRWETGHHPYLEWNCCDSTVSGYCSVNVRWLCPSQFITVSVYCC